jgi:hypothetical protein
MIDSSVVTIEPIIWFAFGCGSRREKNRLNAEMALEAARRKPVEIKNLMIGHTDGTAFCNARLWPVVEVIFFGFLSTAH